MVTTAMIVLSPHSRDRGVSTPVRLLPKIHTRALAP